MADRITEIQDCLDQLLTQAVTTLQYISTSHQPASVPGQPYQPPNGVLPGEEQAAASPNQVSAPGTPHPSNPEMPDVATIEARPPPALFEANLRELAKDLVGKEKEIEGLVKCLPGLERGREQQEEELRILEEEMQAVRTTWLEKGRVKEQLVERVERSLMSIRRVG